MMTCLERPLILLVLSAHWTSRQRKALITYKEPLIVGYGQVTICTADMR